MDHRGRRVTALTQTEDELANALAHEIAQMNLAR
jgi:hypothetical protein